MRAIDTVAALALEPEATDVEGVAKVALKRSDFACATAEKVVRCLEVPDSKTRDNVIPDGKSSVQSMLLGLYCHGGDYGLTRATARFPWTTRYLLGLLRDRWPNFPCTSIQVNKKSPRKRTALTDRVVLGADFRPVVLGRDDVGPPGY